MPFIEDKEQVVNDKRLIPMQEFGDDPTAMETALAMYRTENTIGSFFAQEKGLPDQVDDRSFNPFDYLSDDEKLDKQFVKNVALADTEDEINAVRRQRDRERKDRETIANAGAMAFPIGMGVSGLADPINFIPIGGAVAGTYKAGKSVLSAGVVTASISAASTAAQEAALHATQIERTYGESAINVGASALIGGVLGLSGAKLKQYFNDRDIKAIADSMEVEPKVSRGQNAVITTTVVDEEAAKADFILQQKEQFIGLAGNKMSRGERKALEAEAKGLQQRIDAIEVIPEQVEADKAVPKRKAKRQAIEAGQKAADEERKLLQEQLDAINTRLDADGTYRAAEANLSRLEQGIIPDELQPEFEKYLDQNKAAYTSFIDQERNVIAQMAADEGITPEQLSVGAAQVAQGVEVTGKVGKFLVKALAFDPLSRTITSINPVTRRIANALAENPIAMDGATMTAAESLAKLHDGKYAMALQTHLDFYEKYLQSRTTAVQRAAMKTGVQFDGVMGRRQFNEAVAKAMRDNHSEIPEAMRAAESWRKELYEPMKNEMIALNMLPEDVDVTTAAGYLNRSWNRKKIAANMPSFVQKVSAWLRDEDVNLYNKAKQAAEDIKTADAAEAKRLQKIIDKAEFKQGLDLEENDYEDIARQIARRIMSSPDGRLPYDWKMGDGNKSGSFGGTSLRGPMRSRTFQIPDQMVEEFLDNDIEDLGMRYLRQTAVDVELTRKFGDVEMTAEKAEITEWYQQAIEKAKTEKERIALQKKLDSDIEDIAAMRDRLRGVYGNVDPDNPWVRAGRVARNLNYLRLMGGVVASSVPDVARIIMAEGIGRTFSKGLKPLVTNLRQFKVAAAEAKRYGVGVDALMGGRSQIISDISDYTLPKTAVERGIQSMTDNFGRINMMDYWTAGVKQLHAVTMQNGVIDDLLKGKIDKRLKRLGINDDDALNIKKELEKHAEKVDGVWLSNAKKWDSPELEKLWGAALRKESDRVIVVPGQEKPLFMSSEMGKTFFQFKSFMFSSTQRMTIAALQGQDHNAVAGVMMLTSLGMMSYAFKQWDAGREIGDNPVELITEGIDRSGVLGGLMEVNNTMEKLSSNNFGLRPLLGVDAPAARFASRSMAENMLGPTFGSFLDTSLRVANAGMSEDGWNEKDTRALRRLLPYQNLTFVRQGLDEIEKKIGDL